MKIPALFILLTAPILSMAEPMEPIPLWPEGVPGEADLELPEESSEDKNNDGIIRISNVSNPTLTIYPAPADKATGTAVLVSPGGGYSILANSHEGTRVCEWLNSIGVTAGLLKYRVPRREGREKHEAPLEDTRKALQLMREKADALEINPERIGALGFSAGGHLSFMTTAALPADERAKFGILIYPAYLQSEEDNNALAPEVKVDKDTPPMFIAVAHGDRRFVEGSALLYLGMRRADADAELHIYGQGGHGFGISDNGLRVSDWPELAEGWMEEMGLLGEKAAE